MRRARSLALLLLGVAAAARGAAAQAPAYWLRLSDQVGQSSRYRTSFVLAMRAEYTGAGAGAGELEMEARARELLAALAKGMEVRSAIEYEQRLAAVEADGTREFRIRWHDYDYTGRIGEQEIAPPAAQLEAARAVLAQSARLRVTPSGRTLSVEYGDARLAAAAQQLERMKGGMPAYLPEEPVKVGDSWSATSEFPVGLTPEGQGTLTLELRHTLREVRQGPQGAIAVIDLAGSYASRLTESALGSGAPLHVQASLTGSALFDIAGGRYLGGTYEIDLYALQAAGGVELGLTGHANGTLELLENR
jgi:hypothetical protein